MGQEPDRSDVPVVMAYNVDPDWPAEDTNEVNRESLRLAMAMIKSGHPLTLVPVLHGDLQAQLRAIDPKRCVVFNWCESLPGVPRSESLVVERLEAMGFTYTGATSDALTLSSDKCRVRELLGKKGIGIPEGKLFEKPEANGWRRFPAIVKAGCSHGSEGLTKESVVMNREELKARVTWVLETLQQPALVEEFIDGREIYVSLWGNGTIEALPPTEVDFSATTDLRERVCTYETKFETTRRRKLRPVAPESLSPELLQELNRVALECYRLVGCRDYARVDFRLSGEGKLYVLDINPNPDITFNDSMAVATRQVGLNYGAMGSRLVNLAAQRHPVLKK